MSFGADPTLSRGSAPDEAAATYLRAVRRYWMVVLGAVIIALVGAFVAVQRRGPTYQATASVLVSPLSLGDPDFVGLGANVDTGDPIRNVQTAANLLGSPQVAATVAQAMGRGWSPSRVEQAVSVVALGQSNVVSIAASAHSAGTAARLANLYARDSVAYRGTVVQQNVAVRLAALKIRAAAAPAQTRSGLSTSIGALESIRASGGDPTLSLSQLAVAPTTTSGTSRWLIYLLALLAGLAVGSVAAVLFDYFGRRVRGGDEVAALLGTPVLAGIPKVSGGRRNHGLSPLMLPPDAFEQLRVLRAQLPNELKSYALMVTSSDAQDGKTSVAAGLAVALAEAQHDVILMDLDVIKPDTLEVFGVEGVYTELGSKHQRLEEMLITVPGFDRLQLLPAPRLSDFETLLERLPLLLTEAKYMADWVILDTAPVGVVGNTLRVASACDGALMVVRPRHTDRTRLVVARDMLTRVGATLLGCVIVGETVAPAMPSYYGYAYARDGQPQPSTPSGGVQPRTKGTAPAAPEPSAATAPEPSAPTAPEATAPTSPEPT